MGTTELPRFKIDDCAIDTQTGYRVWVEDVIRLVIVLAVRDGNRWRYRKAQGAFEAAEANRDASAA